MQILSISNGSIRKRNNGYVGQVTVTYEDGSKARRSVTERTSRKCQRALGALKRSIINGVEYIPPSVISNQQRRAKRAGVSTVNSIISRDCCYVDYLANTWLKEKRLEGCTNNTLSTHEQRINGHISDFFRDMTIEEIMPRTIVEFYTYLKDKGLKPITIKKFSHILTNSFKFLVRDGLMNKNPAEYVKTPKVVYAEKRALTDDEIKRLLSCAIAYNKDPQTLNHNMHMFIKLALASGMRKGELCALMWNFVDFKNNTITVKYSLEEIDGVCNLKPPKTNKTRVVAITPDVMAELQEHRKKYAYGRYVFPANKDKNEPMPLSSCFRAFKRIRNRAKLEDISIHQLRHTHATKLANSGVPVHVVRERLGHASLSTTMNYYVHSNSEQDKQAADIFSDL